MLSELSKEKLIDVAADEWLDYDIRIEATKELLMREGVSDADQIQRTKEEQPVSGL